MSTVSGASQIRTALDDRDRAIKELLERMSRGDRESAAEFITRFGPKLRRRVRGKLNASMRRLFDSQDILSTVGRRLDLYVRDRRLQVDDEAQLWGVILRMANNALIDKARLFARLRQVEGADGQFARNLLDRLQRLELSAGREVESEIDLALRSLPDHEDRRILSFWLHGQPHEQIAEDLGISAALVRKRWQNIKARLRAHFEKEEQ